VARKEIGTFETQSFGFGYRVRKLTAESKKVSKFSIKHNFKHLILTTMHFKPMLSISILAIFLFSCSGESPEEKKKNEEIIALKKELREDIERRRLFDLDTNTISIDSLKHLIEFKSGKITEKEHSQFLDSIADIRLKETYIWRTSTGGNPIDGEWKFAMTIQHANVIGERNFLKLEQHGDKVWLLFMGTYFCDDNPTVDLALKVDGEDKVYKTRGAKTKGNKGIIMSRDFFSSEYCKDFENSTFAYVRVNESHCDTEIIKVSMLGVKDAIDFLRI
jgi:hypothetical protein